MRPLELRLGAWLSPLDGVPSGWMLSFVIWPVALSSTYMCWQQRLCGDCGVRATNATSRPSWLTLGGSSVSRMGVRIPWVAI
jgi:hypothetical protein